MILILTKKFVRHNFIGIDFFDSKVTICAQCKDDKSLPFQDYYICFQCASDFYNEKKRKLRLITRSKVFIINRFSN